MPVARSLPPGLVAGQALRAFLLVYFGLPVGLPVQLLVQGRDALVFWGD